MGGVRANWHLSALDISEGEDPFQIEEVGKPIDLSQDIPKLIAELETLGRRERHWARRGVTCALKNRLDHSCLSCPEYTEAHDDPLHWLCRIGREQERVWAQAEVLGDVERQARDHAEAAGVLQALDHAEGVGIPALAEMAEALA